MKGVNQLSHHLSFHLITFGGPQVKRRTCSDIRVCAMYWPQVAFAITYIPAIVLALLLICVIVSAFFEVLLPTVKTNTDTVVPFLLICLSISLNLFNPKPIDSSFSKTERVHFTLYSIVFTIQILWAFGN